MIYPCPKPMKVPRERKRLPRTKDSERGRLVRACDAECRHLVKRLALYRCECGCKGEPTNDNPLDWSHGYGRAQVWALRWAHSNTFALLRSCDRRLHRLGFGAFQALMVSSPAWARVQRLEVKRPKVGMTHLLEILLGLRRGIFIQGGRT